MHQRFQIYLAYLSRLPRAVFCCNHVRTPVHEGKCLCPDCGRGVVFQWIVLKCPDCGQRRESRYLLRDIVPNQACCPHCGTRETLTETLHGPAYYQLRHARLVVVSEDSYITEHPRLSQSIAWVLDWRNLLPAA